MSEIHVDMTIGDFAAVVSAYLESHGISVVLTGGAVVSIYTDNRYESGDADFISAEEQDVILKVLGRYGFVSKGRSLAHPRCNFGVEFPGRIVILGTETQTEVDEVNIKGKNLKILSPTQSVMDRLSAYIVWKDIQCLDQAAWICEEQEVILSRVYKWAKAEGATSIQMQKIKSRCEAGQKTFLTQRTLLKKVSLPIPEKVHPWRVCPLGYHFVREHLMVTKSGKKTIRHEHCATNPSKKDLLSFDELMKMTENEFKNLQKLPAPIPFDFKTKGNKYDQLIGGWVQYWNEVMKPDTQMDPDVIKALIASESGFKDKTHIKSSKRNFTYGLLQITDQTLAALRNERGEIKDHYVALSKAEAYEPSANICAGVRWLYQKQKLASGKLGRQASWEEAVGEYKSAIETYKPKVTYTSTMKDYLNRLQWLKTGKEPK